jgi:ABC-type transport system involved in cytochrome bd biosynthesis fused ATPase/permease subunit
MFQYRRIEVHPLRWRTRIVLFAGIALAAAGAIALAVVSLALAVILLPIVAVALLIARWRFGRLMAEARARHEWRDDSRTIAVDYSRIDGGNRA